MPRVNFREADDIFGHIDGRFVSSSWDLKTRTAVYQVRFYPDWQHPRLKEALRNNWPWSFTNIPDDAHKVVTVHAINLRDAQFHPQDYIDDWFITQDDPKLWKYEGNGSLLCNSSVDMLEWLEILDKIRLELGLRSWEFDWMMGSIEQVYKFGASSSFHLGSFPYRVRELVKRELEARGVELFRPGLPERQEPPFMLIAESDYIIAEDFEVEVPEFEHRDEWFQPRWELPKGD